MKGVLNTSHWNLENVKTLRGLFYLCKNLKKIPGIDKWNPTNLQECIEMFYGCTQSLVKEQISQVMKWENVEKKIKNKHKKGFNNKNFFDFIIYCLTENIDETALNVLDFIKKFC